MGDKHFFAVLILLLLLKIHFLRYPSSLPQHLLQKTYVILSSSLTPRYLFVLPITVATWQKLGVEPIVLLIGDKNELNYQINVTLHLLQEMSVSIHFLQPKQLSSSSMSQISRLFAPVLPSINEILADDDVIITSDADLAVFKVSNHAPNILKGKSIHLYNADCCELIKVPPMRGNNTVKMFPMGTIGATVKTWKDIMEYEKTEYSVDEMEDYIINEFGENFIKSQTNNQLIGSALWFADQSLISYKINEWRKNKINNDSIFEQTTSPHRIDRISWPSAQKFRQMNIREYDDCHQPTAAFEDEEWQKYLPFLKAVFKNDFGFFCRILEYRDAFK